MELLAKFKRFPIEGEDAGPVEVSINGQHYSVNWNTDQYTVPEGAPFRMVVHAGDIMLGAVDLIRYAKNSYRNYSTNNVLKRSVNGTVPLSFRIENGALCANTSVECFEGSVGPAGGTFTIVRADGTKPAGTEFPAGALTATVNLIIERYLGECLPTDAPQYQGCYRFRTEPHVENFELPATVGVCLFDQSALSYFNSGQLRLWKWSEKAGDPITELERVTIQYLECPPLTQLGMRAGSPLLLGAARAGAVLLKPLASLLLPREAHAFGVYEGGKLINFSRIGWVRPLSVEVKSGDNQTGVAGQPLPQPLSMRVINKYGTLTQGVSGRVLNFTPSGDGMAQPPSTVTDLLGEASASWTLSTTAGANTLLARSPTSRAIAPTPYEAEVVFNATGTPAYSLLWLPGLGPTDQYEGTPMVGLLPTLRLSVVGGQQLSTLPVYPANANYMGQWAAIDLDESVIYRLTVALDGRDLGYVDVQVKDGGLYTVDGNRHVYTISPATAFTFKFKLLQ